MQTLQAAVETGEATMQRHADAHMSLLALVARVKQLAKRKVCFPPIILFLQPAAFVLSEGVQRQTAHA